MRIASMFSGVGGFDLGLERAGHEVVAQCESDAHRQRVLERHWPEVPCSNDVRTLDADTLGRAIAESSRSGDGGAESRTEGGREKRSNSTLGIDLVCGGFPCQDLSVAGRRRGLSGERSGLFFEFARIADAVLPDGGWILIENVPGLLSSHDGRDFAVLLATLAELGFHDLAYRVLDSRYFGVPQRRRRVFILARRSRGDRAKSVLLEPESGGGNTSPRRTSREGSAVGVESRPLGAGSQGKRGWRDDLDHGAFITGSVSAKWRKGSGGPSGDECQNLVAGGGPGPDDADLAGALTTPGENSGSFRFDDQDVSGNHIVTTDEAATRGNPAGKGVSYAGRRREDDENLVVGFGSSDANGDDAANTLRANGLDGGRRDQVPMVAFEVWPESSSKSGPGQLNARETDEASAIGGVGHPGKRSLQGTLAFTQNQRDEVRDLGDEAASLEAQPGTHQRTYIASEDGAGERTANEFPTLRGFGHGWQGQHHDDAARADLVRRLSPTECERLQGFPDGWTVAWGPSLASAPSWYQLPHEIRAELARILQPLDPSPDGPRYAACGDAVTVPVAEWIGLRLMKLANEGEE